ncbi:MAG: hypothetical protein PHH54_07025 [Candidatus Nanoarchaeia archaeon]|nr:hypothetical protein [Candidatus Nanoarchaeia archaeon]MDD5741707.1 hypothetical protein [Candidatus Nanoarchaeia archaeon]
MDCFIKKIFEGKTLNDELVHFQFIKFGKGQFGEKAMIRGKNSDGNYSIDTTSEYAKELIISLAEKIGKSKVSVTGALISTLNLDGRFDYKERKMAMGVKKYMIEKEMTGQEILELCNKIDRAFFALSFGFGDDDLKIQAKSPKSAKGAGSAKKEDAKAKINFCKLKTKDKELVKSLLLDDEMNFKKIEIKHNFEVNEIVIPKNEKDFAKIREMAKRKGKIIRELDIDGKKLKKEVNFEA